MYVATNKFTEGDQVRFLRGYLNDDFSVAKGMKGTVLRYDDFLVVVSVPDHMTVCVREDLLEKIRKVERCRQHPLRPGHCL